MKTFESTRTVISRSLFMLSQTDYVSISLVEQYCIGNENRQCM